MSDPDQDEREDREEPVESEERDEDHGDLEPLREDPETGSTPTDPSAERTGPYGQDPMAGEAPSG